MSRTLDCEVTGFGSEQNMMVAFLGGGGVEGISIIFLKITLKAIHKKIILHLFWKSYEKILAVFCFVKTQQFVKRPLVSTLLY